MFGLLKEFILLYAVDHARPQLSGDDCRVRALLGFAGEEAKHIHLFKRFREEFEGGLGRGESPVIGRKHTAFIQDLRSVPLKSLLPHMAGSACFMPKLFPESLEIKDRKRLVLFSSLGTNMNQLLGDGPVFFVSPCLDFTIESIRQFLIVRIANLLCRKL